MSRTALLLSVFMLSFTAAAAHAAEAGIDDYLGKWDLVLSDTGTSFRASSLVVSKSGEDATVSGELVWRWGSAWSFDDPKVLQLTEKGELLVHNQGLWREPLRLRRIGDALEGKSHEKDGKRFTVVGTPAILEVAASGTWNLVAALPDGERDAGRLEISDAGAGRITARAWDRDGEKVTLNAIDLDGEKLRARFQGEEQELTFEADLRGDRLSGRVPLPDGQVIKIKGTRRRAFGPPVRLLAKDGTQGWHPRDRSREFKWTCSEGVLTNGSHDVDVVSDAQFQDFKLSLQYKVDKEGSNSGIYLRGRYEVQILGNKRLQDHGNGAVYSRIRPLANPFSGVGEWQNVEALVIGRYLTVVMNGTTVIDNQRLEGITGGALLPFEHRPGPIMLQGDHGKIYYRNVEIAPALR